MRHIYILIIFSFGFIFSASGDPINNNLLKGTIKDEKGNAIIGAVISIPDLKIGTVSDTNGNYVINDVPKGRFLVEVRLLSYNTGVVNVNISNETIQNITLKESALEMNEVVVTGQSKATELKRSPIPIVAINNEYLHQNSSSNIIDAIAKIPGITAVTTGPNISKPYIRGLGYNRVLTLYNGMRQEGQQWGDEHGIEVDQYSVDRIEVIKGPSSLIYGSDALAGVVNLIPAPPAPDGKIIGDITAEYKTNNGLAGGSAMLSGNKNGFYWLARLSNKEAKNYQNPIDGSVYGTNFKETDASASLGLNKKWGYTHLDLSLFDDLQAIPDGSRDSASRKFTKQITEADTLRQVVPENELNTYTIPVLHQHIQHYRILSSNSFYLGESKLNINVGYERSVRREFSHPEAGDVAGLFLQLNTYTYDVKYYLPEYKGWNTTIGINGMYQTNNVINGTDFLIPSYHQFDAGPFALLTKNFGRLDISGGVRYDSRTFNNDELYSKPDPNTGFDKYVTGADTVGGDHHFNQYSHTFSGFTGSLGATYIFSNSLSAKVNVARGFWAPNIAEISSNGVHPGTASYQLGNTDFKPEFSLQEDVELDYISKHLSVSISAFNNDITNYIFNQKLLTSQGADSIITPGYPTFQFQAGHAQLYGGELSIDIHPHPLDWLHFENSISVVYALNKGTGGQVINDSAKYLPFIPPFHGISELRANFKRNGKYLQNTFVKIQLQYYAAQDRAYLAYNTETPTPGYTLFNAALGADITNRKGMKLFNVSVFGDNIFDVAYQSHLSRLKYFEQYTNDPRGHTGIYNMGRNFGIKISVPLLLR
ncbi:MAG: TonB-dependent receptor [Taibaiella sp.]|nr:TonB-dependent receptor [Taibaiella sp.]